MTDLVPRGATLGRQDRHRAGEVEEVARGGHHCSSMNSTAWSSRRTTTTSVSSTVTRSPDITKTVVHTTVTDDWVASLPAPKGALVLHPDTAHDERPSLSAG